MEEQVLKIKLGHEYKAHIESQSEFKGSIFKEIYDSANRHLCDIIKQSNKKEENNTEHYNNIVAFTGERGTGKSSAMISFVNSLKAPFEVDIVDEKRTYKFNILQMIDPSLFRDKDRLFEIIITKMFSNFQESIKNDENVVSQENKRKLIDIFQKVYKDLKILNQDKNEIYGKDVIEALSDLAYGTNLKDKFRQLVDTYLEVLGDSADFLVIPIDDFDLNQEGAYNMLEDIRQFLVQSKIIILIACKIEQLKDALRHEIVSKTVDLYNPDVFKHEGVYAEDKPNEKAERYLEKLIPLDRRLHTDKISVERSYRVQVFDDEKVLFDKPSVEELVVTLIRQNFNLFIPLGGSGSRNYFIGNTLRQMIHQIVLFYNTKDVNHFMNYINKQKKDFLNRKDVEIYDELNYELGNRSRFYFELLQNKNNNQGADEGKEKKKTFVCFSDVLESYLEVLRNTRVTDFSIQKRASYLAVNYSLSNLINTISHKDYDSHFIHNYFHKGLIENETQSEEALLESFQFSGFKDFMSRLENSDDFEFILCFISILGRENNLSREIFTKRLSFGEKRFDKIQFNANNFISTLFRNEILFLDDKDYKNIGSLANKINTWEFEDMSCFSNLFFASTFRSHYSSAFEKMTKNKLLTGSLGNQLQNRIIEGYRLTLDDMNKTYPHLKFDNKRFMQNPIFLYWEENSERINNLINQLYERKSANVSELAGKMLKQYKTYFEEQNYSGRGAKQSMNNLIKKFQGINEIHKELKTYRGEMNNDVDKGIRKIERKLKDLVDNG
ncbi:MAG: hypothetical protein COA32_16495 [Fluviicola sp.]|nr:MAG: hypothetical protein COA32_16495 [Fluviicola sp.]